MPISSCQEYFDTLEDRFVASASKGIDAIYQFELIGDGGGTWHVVVKDGAIEVGEGSHPAPSSTVTAGAGDYVKIANDEMNGPTMRRYIGYVLTGSSGLLRSRMNVPIPAAQPHYHPQGGFIGMYVVCCGVM